MTTSIARQTNLLPITTFVVLIWGLLAFAAGYFQLYAHVPMPLFGVSVILIQVSLIAAYFFIPSFRSFSDSIPLTTIALFHAWRIFAGWIFFAYANVLPDLFIRDAAYGDIVSGFLGLGAVIAGRTKISFWIFNIIGMADFIIAVGTGLTLTILGEPAMQPIAALPLIMIPFFGVPLSGYTHFISIVRLVKLGASDLFKPVE